MTSELSKRLLTTEAYHVLIKAGIFDEDDHIELLNGELIEMPPVSNPHIGCIIWLNNILVQQLGNEAIISVHNPIELNLHSEPEPDIAICRFEEHYYRTRRIQPPDIHLIIEVSDSTLQKDRQIKLPLYASAEIPVYWIINLGAEQVEVHSMPDSSEKIYKHIKIATRSDVLEISGFDLKLSVDELFG